MRYNDHDYRLYTDNFKIEKVEKEDIEQEYLTLEEKDIRIKQLEFNINSVNERYDVVREMHSEQYDIMNEEKQDQNVKIKALEFTIQMQEIYIDKYVPKEKQLSFKSETSPSLLECYH